MATSIAGNDGLSRHLADLMQYIKARCGESPQDVDKAEQLAREWTERAVRLKKIPPVHADLICRVALQQFFVPKRG